MTTIERRIEIAATPEAVFDTLRPRLAGTIDSTVTMSVTSTAAGARVTRTVELGVPRRLVPARGLIVSRSAARASARSGR